MPEPLFENDQQRERSFTRWKRRTNLETVTQILSKVTHLPLEQIKPCLHTWKMDLQETFMPATPE